MVEECKVDRFTHILTGRIEFSIGNIFQREIYCHLFLFQEIDYRKRVENLISILYGNHIRTSLSSVGIEQSAKSNFVVESPTGSPINFS